MASPTRRKANSSNSRAAAPPSSQATANTQHPTVDPRWILGAFATVLLASFACAYIALCWLYAQGQWQLVLQPSATVSTTPATLGLAFESVSFDDTEAGQPRLTGWWIPADATSRRGGLTLLYLRDGRGNLGDSVPALAALHACGANIFAIDYRGFGRSEAVHPSEQSMNADADAAWAYLTATRGLAPASIFLYGDKIGSAVAAQAAQRHPDAAGVILIAPFASLLPRALADPRSSLVPARLLFHERFDLASVIGRIGEPKLIGFTGAATCSGAATPCPSPAEVRSLYNAASFPKEMFNGEDAAASPTAWGEFLSRFLDEYGAAAAAVRR